MAYLPPFLSTSKIILSLSLSLSHHLPFRRMLDSSTQTIDSQYMRKHVNLDSMDMHTHLYTLEKPLGHTTGT